MSHSNNSNEIKTIAQLSKTISAPEGVLYAIALKLGFSAESGQELPPQQIVAIKSAYENQSKATPRLPGGQQFNGTKSQGLAEQAPSAPTTTQKPILKRAQENYSGAVQARDSVRDEISVQRLEESQRRGQYAGALNAIIEATSMVDAELEVLTAIRANEIQGLAQLDKNIVQTLESDAFLDRFTSAQKSYAERPITPNCDRVQETLDALKNLRVNSSS
jgi:hypothetical protein